MNNKPVGSSRLWELFEELASPVDSDCSPIDREELVEMARRNWEPLLKRRYDELSRSKPNPLILRALGDTIEYFKVLLDSNPPTGGVA